MSHKGGGGGEAPAGKDYKAILGTIKNPLIFFALALLLIEAILTAVLYSGKLKADQTFIVVLIMCGAFFVVVVLVTLLTIFFPKNLMADLDHAVTELATSAITKAQTKQNLTRLKYDLSAFNGGSLINKSQENQKFAGLVQNPYAVYVKPVLEQISADPQWNKRLSDKLKMETEAIINKPDKTVEEVIHHIDNLQEGL
jgi:hypothetical protein